jgi:MinD-like ATPase involved in chromosome partitioning or flagellar assembly
MSLANTAVLLNSWGYKVLIIDWDLEAPGLEHFFKSFIDIELVKEKNGVIDILHNKEKVSWQDALISVVLNNSNEPIHLISSGKRNDDYFKRVRSFDIDEFYNNGGGEFIEELRDEWKKEYDFVLIDSRTGITEIGGICAVQLPDYVVLLFTATDQGFDGTLDIASRALKAQQKLPFDRQKLAFIPILTKFDTQAEFKLSQKWVHHFAVKLEGIYKDWLPVSIKVDEFIQATKVPYITYFSFGEKLPVLEQSLSDTSGLAYAYENLAGLLANKLMDADALLFSRDRFIYDSRKNHNNFKRPINRGETNTIKIFISYSRKDEIVKSELMSHMSVLTKKHNVSIWSDDYLLPGDDWNDVIEKNLVDSDIILLLISPDYLRSKFTAYEVTQSFKLKKRIIPIIIRQTNEFFESTMSKLYALPRNMVPIEEFENRSQAFTDITSEIERVITSTVRDRSSSI